MTLLPALQVSVGLPGVHETHSLATSALPAAPVVSGDDRRPPRNSPRAARRAVAGALRRLA